MFAVYAGLPYQVRGYGQNTVPGLCLLKKKIKEIIEHMPNQGLIGGTSSDLLIPARCEQRAQNK